MFFFRDINSLTNLLQTHRHSQTSHSVIDCNSSFKSHIASFRLPKINYLHRLSHFHRRRTLTTKKNVVHLLISNKKLRKQPEIRGEAAAYSFRTCGGRHATLMCTSQWNRLDESGGSRVNCSSPEEVAKVARREATATLGKHSHILWQVQSTSQHLN